ncbi:MAG: hypothetical protein FWD09_07685 [Lentimicrobiaceae bacterium]|nr:hypothetical protein [Lentimicrobiaceae bacterium]
MIRIPTSFLYFLPLILCLVLVVSCNRPDTDDNVELLFSVRNNNSEIQFPSPTVHFDTVFSGTGSITRRFTVHNPSSNDVTTTVFLAGGKKSYYSINVNGMPGTVDNDSYFKNIAIPKRDSIFIFVKVNINPSLQNNPFLVTDSIVFLTGRREQDVKLLAYGQDARYIIADQGHPSLRFKVVAGEHEVVRWTNEKPYVVYGWAAIDSTGTLEIEAGTRIHFHANSGLWAYRCSHLKVGNQDGTLGEPVIFRGDRLESWFNEDYAQWSRIWINEGAQVTINHAIITNAFVGVQVEALPYDDGTIDLTHDSSVKIENTIIKNTQHCGVLSRFLNIEMTNCVITNNGASSLQLEGGEYMMKHLTIGNYFRQAERKVPACYVSNKISAYNVPFTVKADFINCIITGRNETEIGVSKDEDANLEVAFQSCLVKSKNNSVYFDEYCLRNEDPKFKDSDKLDFRLLPESPAIGAGKPNIGVDKDILGNSRSNPPSMGAYENGR